MMTISKGLVYNSKVFQEVKAKLDRVEKLNYALYKNFKELIQP